MTRRRADQISDGTRSAAATVARSTMQLGNVTNQTSTMRSLRVPRDSAVMCAFSCSSARRLLAAQSCWSAESSLQS
eukprot:1838766-Rhodomonas_salina.2